MKNAVIFHGTKCSPDNEYYWYAWLKKELEKNGFQAETPHYPEINQESLDTFLPKVLKNYDFTEETILIGHSAGAPLILSILEKLEHPIKRAILVAGYSYKLHDGDPDPILQESYDWEKIRANCQDFVFFNSANDPWGCDDKQGRHLFDKLGGALVIMNDGHFGSQGKKQYYTKFPLLLSAIEVEK